MSLNTSLVSFKCKETLERSTRVLFARLRNEHIICEQRCVLLKCGQGRCPRSYATCNSLNRHLKAERSWSIVVSSGIADAGVSIEYECNGQNYEPPCDEQVLNTVRNYRHGIDSFNGNLYSSHNVKQSNLQTVVDNATDLLGRDAVVWEFLKRTLTGSTVQNVKLITVYYSISM